MATIGPLSLGALHHAISRARRFRSLPPITAGQLVAALISAAATLVTTVDGEHPDDVIGPLPGPGRDHRWP